MTHAGTLTQLPVEPTNVAVARAVLARHGKTFRFASAFLPAKNADDIALLYAFCREVDDAVDEATSVEAGRWEGACITAELAGLRPPRAAIAAFLALAGKSGIDLRFADDFIDGVRSDAAERVRVDDDRALLAYCYRVAGTVGAMMCPLLGVTDRRALPFAIDLGIAMQITNICRDVLEDAGRNRVYLPCARLREVGIDPEHVVAGVADRSALAAVVRDLLELADAHYRRSEQGVRFLPLRARAAILVASRVYRAIGVRLLRRHRGDPLHGRTVVPLVEKLGVALAAVLALPVLALPWASAGGRAREHAIAPSARDAQPISRSEGS